MVINARFPGDHALNMTITTPLTAPNGSNKGRFTINAPNVRPSGNLLPTPGSPQIDAGVPVPNFAGRAGVDYIGRAPDLGARERP